MSVMREGPTPTWTVPRDVPTKVGRSTPQASRLAFDHRLKHRSRRGGSVSSSPQAFPHRTGLAGMPRLLMNCRSKGGVPALTQALTQLRRQGGGRICGNRLKPRPMPIEGAEEGLERRRVDAGFFGGALVQGAGCGPAKPRAFGNAFEGIRQHFSRFLEVPGHVGQGRFPGGDENKVIDSIIKKNMPSSI